LHSFRGSVRALLPRASRPNQAAQTDEVEGRRTQPAHFIEKTARACLVRSNTYPTDTTKAIRNRLGFKLRWLQVDYQLVYEEIGNFQ
jgi:hypothetical protein